MFQNSNLSDNKKMSIYNDNNIVDITPIVGHFVVKILRENKTTIDLSKSNIGKYGAIEISKGLRDNNTITAIDLSNNDIGKYGAIEIAKVLRDNNTITTIDLSKNKIGKYGAIEIAKVLRDNNTITSINLSNNDIGECGAVEMAKALRDNNTVTLVDLSFNRIGIEGAFEIFKALSENTSMQSLILRGVTGIHELLAESRDGAIISHECNQFIDLMSQNKSLTTIDFGFIDKRVTEIINRNKKLV